MRDCATRVNYCRELRVLSSVAWGSGSFALETLGKLLFAYRKQIQYRLSFCSCEIEVGCREPKNPDTISMNCTFNRFLGLFH